MSRQYFSLVKEKETATINIYGDITSFPWMEGDVSAASLSKQLDTLNDVNEISVYINSYGGEVAEGLAIYNSLKRHKAKVKTYCDGFAASIASVIFMAGDERIMNESSLLMIHNAWSCVQGNAEELRKMADDLEKITQASVAAYKAHSDLSEDEIKELMDNESWILPEEAMKYGFATAIEKSDTRNASQNAKARFIEIVKAFRSAVEDEEDENEEDGEGEGTPAEPEEPDNEPETNDNSEDEEETEGEETPEDENSETEEKQDEAAQKWSGFFNALRKM